MMTLNKAQFDQLVDNYANHIIEGLDNDSMEIMLFDLITAEYADYTEEQIIGEVTDIYGEEIAQELLESVTAVPVA
jgi:anaerobic ribonucleoside-triphosphate reductase